MGSARYAQSVRVAAYRPMVHILHAPECCSCTAARTPSLNLWYTTPATRPRRRRWFAWLARLRGWDPVLVYIDVPERWPRPGRCSRGQVVDPVRFAGHWARWEALRTEFVGTPGRLDGALWSDVVLTDRERVAADLRRLVAPAYLPMR